MTTDDERMFHLEQCLTAVSFLFASMVGSKDNDSIVVDAGCLQCLDETANIDIELGQRLVIFGGVVTNGMTCMVELVPADREERWLAVDDESFCHLAKQRRVVFPVEGKVIVVDGHRIYNMLDAIPLA